METCPRRVKDNLNLVILEKDKRENIRVFPNEILHKCYRIYKKTICIKWYSNLLPLVQEAEMLAQYHQDSGNKEYI